MMEGAIVGNSKKAVCKTYIECYDSSWNGMERNGKNHGNFYAFSRWKEKGVDTEL